MVNRSLKSRILMIFIITISLFYLSEATMGDVSSSGVWTELPIATEGGCTPTSYVMCAEDGPHYNETEGTIPYYNESGTDKTYQFCAVDINDEIGFINGTEKGFTNLSGLKEYFKQNEEEEGNIENPDPLTMSSISGNIEGHFDENCNVDELFTERTEENKIDYSIYCENDKCFNVSDPLYDDNGYETHKNIDNFDIITKGLGTMVDGKVKESGTGKNISDVNLTFYFNSEKGLSEYFSLLSDENGEFTTLDYKRNITTYHKKYNDINKIPITDYVIVARHPDYEDYKTNVIPVKDPEYIEISMESYSTCQNDCTLEGSNICNKDCDGVNGCEIEWKVNETYLKEQIDGVPKGKNKQFLYNGKDYIVETCNNIPSEIIPKTPGSKTEGEITCPEGKSAWKKERFVNLDGELVKMQVTVCK
ncbi:MAG: hypothetical protein ACQER9_03455 [Nanobdellota archaeon]